MGGIEIRVFDLSTFEILGLSYNAENIDIEAKLSDYGSFSFSMSALAPYAEQFQSERLVLIDKWYWGIIEEVSLRFSGNAVFYEISGYELKSILRYRYIMPPGYTEPDGSVGFETVSGSTESIVKALVSNNLGSGADADRAVSNLEIAENQNRGNPDNSFEARLEPLNEAIKGILETDSMGYEIKADIENNKLIFDVILGTDRSSEQNDVPPVVFSNTLGNVESAEYRISEKGYKNTFYTALKADEAEETQTVYTYYSQGSLAGLARREQTLSLNLSSEESDFTLVEPVARANMQEHSKTEEFSAELYDIGSKFGTDYFLGDIITLKIDYKTLSHYDGDMPVFIPHSIVAHKQVTGIKLSYLGSEKQLEVTIGTPPKNIRQLIRKIK